MLKWANVPVPSQYIVGLVLGSILQVVFKQVLFEAAWIGDVIGLPLAAAGVGLAAWSILVAGDTQLERPDQLITSGPYSLSRNPMYVAWTLMYVGISLIVNSLWIAALLPVVVTFTHYSDVRLEERFLEKEFGEEYLQYKRRVRRYL
jgi:protein-S-isoprenylcysteine O-methyltransferase Ste14